LILEPKEDIKAKLGYSPDEADAAVLTFAQPVMARSYRPYHRNIAVEYDPYREPEPSRNSNYTYNYNPYTEPW
jgi:hypothetical protein